MSPPCMYYKKKKWRLPYVKLKAALTKWLPDIFRKMPSSFIMSSMRWDSPSILTIFMAYRSFVTFRLTRYTLPNVPLPRNFKI